MMFSLRMMGPYFRPFLWLVLIFEVLGSIYGYYWYKDQLSQTPWYLWLFTWDCPFYATLFSIWLFSYLRNSTLHKNNLFTAITWTGLIKYGIWTVIVVQDSYYWGSPVTIDSLGLQISHVVLFIQGLILLSKVQFKNIGIVTTWMLINDYMDYIVGTYPWMLQEQIRMAMWLAIALTVIQYGFMNQFQLKSWWKTNFSMNDCKNQKIS